MRGSLFTYTLSLIRGWAYTARVGAIQLDWCATPTLARIDPDDECGHRRDYQGDAYQLVNEEEPECQHAKESGKTVEDIADLAGAQAGRAQAVVQVRCIIVQRRLTTTDTVNHHYRDVKDGDAQHHQGQGNFRASHDR